MTAGTLETRGAAFRIGRAVLLDGVDVEVRPGRVTAVVGANGAGKSTLLRLLSGEWRPTSGSVSLEGRSLDDVAPRELARRRAVMPQSSTLTFPFKVMEVVLLGRTPHVRGREGPVDRAAAWSALERAGAEHLADRRYPTLSGGERQRVDFARALAQIWEPRSDAGRYLLLDEPTSSLDLARQHELLMGVRAFAQPDVGVLVVLHDLNLAARYADDLLVLVDGRLAARGAPWSVLTPELIREAFGLPVVVTTHPCHDCPLIVADSTAGVVHTGPVESLSPSSGGSHDEPVHRSH